MNSPNRVDFIQDCKFEKEINGHKLYSRWNGRYHAAPSKFPGAKKEWVVVFPNGDSQISFTKSRAIDMIPKA